MGITCVLKLLILLCLKYICLVNCDTSETFEGVVLVSPVLAPATNSRARLTETAKDFPVLMLFASSNETKIEDSKTSEEHPPIYVKKLTDTRRRREFRNQRSFKSIM